MTANVQMKWARTTRPRPKRPTGVNRHISRGATYALIYGLLVVFVGPLFWLLNTALKQDFELEAFPIHWLPVVLQWGHFVDAVTQVPFFQYAMNSATLSLLFATLATLSSALVGFGFARQRGIGKRVMFTIMLSTIMLPQIVTLFPTYILFARLGLVDTYWPWVLWGLASVPYLVFLFRQFFSNIPQELEDAALIDGCSPLRIFWQIFLPLGRPALATSFILSFAWVWSDFIAPSLLLSQDNTTLAVAIYSGYSTPQGQAIVTVQAAASILYILPMLAVFLFAQRSFVQGIATAGIK